MQTRFTSFGSATIAEVGRRCIVCLAGFGAAACAGDSTGVGLDTQLIMQNSSFSPASLSVPQDMTVVWTNKDVVGHNVKSSDGETELASPPVISQNASFQHVFREVGAYYYQCTIHPGMKGVIIVTPKPDL